MSSIIIFSSIASIFILLMRVFQVVFNNLKNVNINYVVYEKKNLLFSVLVLSVIWLMIEALELRTVSLDQPAFAEELIIPVEVETDQERRQLLASH